MTSRLKTGGGYMAAHQTCCGAQKRRNAQKVSADMSRAEQHLHHRYLDMGQTEGATVDQNQTMEREFRLEPDILLQCCKIADL